MAGLIAVDALLVSDVGSIGALMLHDPSGWIALSLLGPAFAGTFRLAVIRTALAGKPNR
jgi:hypothetical protein